MTGIYNIDYRKIVVIAFLLVTFYWLMIPNSKDTKSSSNLQKESFTTKVIIYRYLFIYGYIYNKGNENAYKSKTFICFNVNYFYF